METKARCKKCYLVLVLEPESRGFPSNGLLPILPATIYSRLNPAEEGISLVCFEYRLVLPPYPLQVV